VVIQWTFTVIAPYVKKPKGPFFATEVTSFGGKNFRDCLKQAKKLVGFSKKTIQFVLHQVMESNNECI